MKFGFALFAVRVLTTALLANVLANAQRIRAPRRVRSLYPGSESYSAPYVEAFRQGLKVVGYLDDRTINDYYRYADGHADRYAQSKCTAFVTVLAEQPSNVAVSAA